MKFCRKELFRNILTHWKYNLLIFLELAACVLMVFVVLYNLNILTSRSSSYISGISDKRYYSMEIEEGSTSFIRESKQLQSQISKIVSTIETYPKWKAYSYAGNSFGLPYDEFGEKVVPEIFEEGYESGKLNTGNPNLQVLKAFSFTPQVFSSFDMKISEGRLFNEDDYILKESEGESTSVILGAAYKDYFKVGDTIHGWGNTKDMKLHVVGFLEEGTLFSSPEFVNMITLDRYIIYPMHSKMIMLDHSETVYPGASALLWMGNIVVSDMSVDVQKEINAITNTYGFPGIKCTQWGGTYMESTENVSQRNIILLSGLALLLCCLAAVSLTHVLSRKAEKNMRSYAVYLISGISPREIIISILMEALLYAALAVLPAVWLSLIQFKTMVVPLYKLLLISLPIVLVSVIPAVRLIAKINLDQLARRKSE